MEGFNFFLGSDIWVIEKQAWRGSTEDVHRIHLTISQTYIRRPKFDSKFLIKASKKHD